MKLATVVLPVVSKIMKRINIVLVRLTELVLTSFVYMYNSVRVMLQCALVFGQLGQHFPRKILEPRNYVGLA